MRSNVIRMTYGIAECNCSRCGKYFIVAPYHMYKSKNKYFCSYTCYNAFLDEKEAKKQQGKKKGAGNEG